MLSKGDDFPIHQSPEPIAYAGQSRNFYDRYFFNGYDIDGDVFFALGMGVYPHLDVIDAGFSLIRNGVQHNILCSRALGMERMDTQVGSIKVVVVEPLHCLRILIDAPQHGIEADLLFRAGHRPKKNPLYPSSWRPAIYGLHPFNAKRQLGGVDQASGERLRWPRCDGWALGTALGCAADR